MTLVRPRRKLICLVVSALLFVNVAPIVHAQTDYGRIVVVVNRESGEQSGLPFGGVTVTLMGERGDSRERTTDSEGRCVFGSLEPGFYTIEARAAGARRTRRVRVGSGQQVTRTLTLSDAPPPQTDDEKIVPSSPTPPAPAPPETEARLAETITPGRQGVNVTTRDAEQLPNRGGSPSSVFDLQPGVFNDDTDTFRQLNINGLSQNVLREGGIDTTPIELSSASFQDTGAFFFNVSERQSFKKYSSFRLDTNNYPAGLGTGTGAKLIGDIEGGKKEHHGELYEYFAHDALGARNFFDFARKPSLSFNLFGVKLGGPLVYAEKVHPQLFYFVNYEGVRARSGHTDYEAAPSLSLRGRAAPAVAPLFDSFRAGGAVLVDGASSDPNYDILRIDSHNSARRDSITARIDYEVSPRDSLGFLFLGSIAREESPAGISGRRQSKRDVGQTFAARYTRTLMENSDGDKKLTNEFIFGFNRNPSRQRALIPPVAGVDLSRIAFNIGGEVPQTGIVGQPRPLAVATPGGILVGSDFGGRESRFRPSNYTFVDQLVWTRNSYAVRVGGELRLVRADTDQLFGTTYNFASLDDFLANRASVAHSGDLGSFSGSPGERKVAHEYYIGYIQHNWKARRNLSLVSGLRYEYFSVLREARDRAVIFDPAEGTLLASAAPLYKSRKNNLLPRVAVAWAPFVGSTPLEDINLNSTVISASYGMHVGPGVFDNLLRPVLSDRLKVSRDALAFPADTGALAASFAADPVGFQPLALSRDYVSPARVHKFDVSLKQSLIRRDASSDTDNDDADVNRELFVVLTYSGNRGRNLLLRNFANRIVSVKTNADPTKPAEVEREFDFGSDAGTLPPFGEVDYLTSGGRSSYDSFQVSLKGRARKFLRFAQFEYTLARSRGNTEGDDAIPAGNTFDYNYDFGDNASDVRHKFSFGTVFFLNCTYIKLCVDTNNRFVKELTSNWTIAAIGNFQTGSPLDIRLKRPDVAYIDDAGRVFSSPATGRRAVLNLPGGGSSTAALRPDLIPGVNPYLDGFADLLYLNPAAFAIPAPGAFGNLPRGALRGPGRRLVDLSFSKDIDLDETFDAIGGGKSIRIGVDITNVFNITNFKLTSAKLPDKLGIDAASNQLQPGQPFTAEAAGHKFAVPERTFKRKQDLGGSRQIQLSVTFKF